MEKTLDCKETNTKGGSNANGTKSKWDSQLQNLKVYILFQNI